MIHVLRTWIHESWCPFSPSEKEEIWKEATKLAYKMKPVSGPGANSTATPQAASKREDLIGNGMARLMKKRRIAPSTPTKDASPLHPEILDWKVHGTCVGLGEGYRDYPVLHSWMQKSSTSPDASKAALMVLGLMVAAARVERAWSAAGIVVDDLGSSLKPEMLSMLVFIKRNWAVLLHTVIRKYVVTKHGKNVTVEREVKEVNVDTLRELYIKMYGKDPAAERRKAAANKAAAAAKAKAAAEAHAEAEAAANEEDAAAQCSGDEVRVGP